MKKTNLFNTCLLFSLSIILIAGCSSGKNTAGSKKGFKSDEFVINENSSLKDPVSNLTWTYYRDNPTTYFRYRLETNTGTTQLPSVEQINALLEKVSFQLNQKKDKGNIRVLPWFSQDCAFLSNSSVKTPEGEVLYEVVFWTSLTKEYKTGTVTGGDLITILLIK